MQATSHLPTDPHTSPSMSHKTRDPLQCPVCERTFSRKDNLRTHQRLHTGEKPFLCKYCSQPFRWAGALHTHENLHRRGGKAFKFTHPSRPTTSSSNINIKRHPTTQSTRRQSRPFYLDGNLDHSAHPVHPVHAVVSTPRIYTTLITQPAHPFRLPDVVNSLPLPTSSNTLSSPLHPPLTSTPHPSPIPFPHTSSPPISSYSSRNQIPESRPPTTLPHPLLPPIKFPDLPTTPSHLNSSSSLPPATLVLRLHPSPSASTVAPPAMSRSPEQHKLPPVSHDTPQNSSLGYRLPSLARLAPPRVEMSQSPSTSFLASSTGYPVAQPHAYAQLATPTVVSSAEQESFKCRTCSRVISSKDALCSPEGSNASKMSFVCKSCTNSSQWNGDAHRQDIKHASVVEERRSMTRQEKADDEEESTDTITVRLMKQSDSTNGLFALLERRTAPPPVCDEQFAQVLEEREATGKLTVVALEKGRVVGTGALFMARMFVHGGTVIGRVVDVVVESGTGNESAHKAIVQKLVELGWEGGCHKILVESDEEDVTLNESCGFATEKKRMSMCVHRAR